MMPGVVFLILLILGTTVAFVFRQRILRYRKLVHVTVATLAAVGAGLVLKAQPSTTQILTLTGSAIERRFPAAIFLSEPLIFIFWISIVITLFVWGRGFFCGWLCPYGALLEVLLNIWQAVVPEKVRHKLESWEPPSYWRFGKYVTFLVILLVSFFSLPLAETLDEVEPFKTFVLRLARPVRVRRVLHRDHPGVGGEPPVLLSLPLSAGRGSGHSVAKALAPARALRPVPGL